jgi:hypothetical protein
MEPDARLQNQLNLLHQIRDIKPAQVLHYAVMPVADMVFMVFLVSKLFHIGDPASWSWWWICAPLYIPILIKAGIQFVSTFIKNLKRK